jgi:hypothetical protein
MSRRRKSSGDDDLRVALESLTRPKRASVKPPARAKSKRYRKTKSKPSALGRIIGRRTRETYREDTGPRGQYRQQMNPLTGQMQYVAVDPYAAAQQTLGPYAIPQTTSEATALAPVPLPTGATPSLATQAYNLVSTPLSWLARGYETFVPEFSGLIPEDARRRAAVYGSQIGTGFLQKFETTCQTIDSLRSILQRAKNDVQETLNFYRHHRIERAVLQLENENLLSRIANAFQELDKIASSSTASQYGPCTPVPITQLVFEIQAHTGFWAKQAKDDRDFFNDPLRFVRLNASAAVQSTTSLGATSYTALLPGPLMVPLSDSERLAYNRWREELLSSESGKQTYEALVKVLQDGILTDRDVWVLRNQPQTLAPAEEQELFNLHNRLYAADSVKSVTWAIALKTYPRIHLELLRRTFSPTPKSSTPSASILKSPSGPSATSSLLNDLARSLM